MSLAENLLNSLDETAYENSILAEIEPEGHIIVGQDRVIRVPQELKTIAVTGDKDIESVTFDCVRYWDGNDLSTFAIYLNYVLPDHTQGTYIPEAVTTSEGENVFHFDWKIKNNITTKSGKISFAITAVKTKQNENGESVVDKQWSSLPNGDCAIASGLNISSVPSEEESGDVVAQLSAILEQIHGNVDEWIKNVIAQTTGTSTTEVMSQKAVTDALNNYKSETIEQSYQYTNEKTAKIDEIEEKLGANSSQIALNNERLTTLEKDVYGVLADKFVDNTMAYIKDVPPNALSYAKIEIIGGATKGVAVGKNLADIPNGTYYFEKSSTTGGNENAIYTTTAPQDGYYVCHALFKDWVAEEVTAGFPSTLYISGNTQSENPIWFSKGDKIKLVILPPTASDISGTIYNIGLYKVDGEESSIPTYEPCVKELRSASVTEIVSTGANLIPFSFPVPEAVQTLDGYGEGANEAYNYIDYDKKQFVKCVRKIVLNGTEYWMQGKTASGALRYQLRVTPSIKRGGMNIICDQYKTVTTSDTWNDINGIAINGDLIEIKDSNCATQTDFKARLAENPITVYYELDTPEVIDISDILPEDNYIEVERGGMLTFKNEYEYDVPSEVVFVTKGASE